MSTLLECHVGVVEVDCLNAGGHELRHIGSELHHQLKLYVEYKILDNTNVLLPQLCRSNCFLLYIMCSHLSTRNITQRHGNRLGTSDKATEMQQAKYCTDLKFMGLQ